jgi:ribonuclease-3
MANIDGNIARVEQIVGYTFANKLFCAGALQMAGLPGRLILNGTVHSIEKNGRLAVVGDSIMAAVLCSKWHDIRNAQGSTFFDYAFSSCDGHE